MNTLIHADIFFFVTTIAVILIALVLIVIFIYIAVILADIREISRLVRKESGEIAEDLKGMHAEIRANVRKGSSSMASIFNMFKWFSSKRKKRSKE